MYDPSQSPRGKSRGVDPTNDCSIAAFTTRCSESVLVLTVEDQTGSDSVPVVFL